MTRFDPYIHLDTENGSSVFKYGPSQSRYHHLQVLFHDDGSVTTDKTHYVGGLFEAHSGSNGDYNLNYIRANGETVAIVKEREGNYETSYTHRNYQGSVVAITNDNGELVESISYQAFGKRSSSNANGDSSISRGYTGHEHLDHVSAIHMNGRIYDPNLRRMLSADPTIPDPMNTQAYNRYSYVLNNPLRYTDPSGFSWFDRAVREVRRFGRRAGAELERAGRGARDYLEDELFERETWVDICGSGCYVNYETNGQESEFSGEIVVGGGSAQTTVGFGQSSSSGRRFYANNNASGNTVEISYSSRTSTAHLSLNGYELYSGALDVLSYDDVPTAEKLLYQFDLMIMDGIDTLSDKTREMLPSGVIAVGGELTSVAIFVGGKLAGGLAFDLDSGEFHPYYSYGGGVSGVSGNLVAGREGSAAITFSFTESLDKFVGESISVDITSGPVGGGVNVIQDVGVVGGTFKIATGKGSSYVTVTTCVVNTSNLDSRCK